METIKGLIIKDLLQLKNYKRTLIVFICIFIGTSIIQEHTRNVLTIMMTLGISMFSVASLSYDEMAKADKYILTLPLTKKEVILSKYILVVGSTVIGAIVGMMMTIIITLIVQKDLPNLQELIGLGTGSIFAMAILDGIQIPSIYKYGAEKGRMQIVIIMAILGVIVGGVGLLGNTFHINFLTNGMITMLMNYLPIILMMGTVIIYLISYQVCYKIYVKKEM